MFFKTLRRLKKKSLKTTRAGYGCVSTSGHPEWARARSPAFGTASEVVTTEPILVPWRWSHLKPETSRTASAVFL